MPVDINVFQAFADRVLEVLSKEKKDAREDPKTLDDETAVPLEDGGQLPTDSPRQNTRSF
jgi:hypothetical protein